MTYKPGSGPCHLEKAIRPFSTGAADCSGCRSARNARAVSTIPPAATASASAAAASRRPGGVGELAGGASSRSPSAGQRSGGRTFVRARKYSSRLAIIGLLQEFAEAPPGAAEQDVDAGVVEPIIRAISFAGYPAAWWSTTAARCFSERLASAAIRSRASSSISYAPSVCSVP